MLQSRNYRINDVLLHVQRKFDPSLGHNRCYDVFFLKNYNDHNSRYLVPFYPKETLPVYIGRINVVAPSYLEVVFHLDSDIKWIGNAPTFMDALKKILDMFVAEALHRTFKKYKIYYRLTHDSFYTVVENGHVWLYAILDGAGSQSHLVGCFNHEHIAEYVVQAFALGPQAITDFYNKIRSHVRER